MKLLKAIVDAFNKPSNLMDLFYTQQARVEDLLI